MYEELVKNDIPTNKMIVKAVGKSLTINFGILEQAIWNTIVLLSIFKAQLSKLSAIKVI